MWELLLSNLEQTWRPAAALRGPLNRPILQFTKHHQLGSRWIPPQLGFLRICISHPA